MGFTDSPAKINATVTESSLFQIGSAELKKNFLGGGLGHRYRFVRCCGAKCSIFDNNIGLWIGAINESLSAWLAAAKESISLAITSLKVRFGALVRFDSGWGGTQRCAP